MANNFDSNITRKVMRSFLDKFESERVLTKNVNTQLFAGAFNGSTGDTIDVKRPTDYVSVRTANGDLTSESPSDIITGKASAVVQDYFTAFVDFDEADEAIKMDQLDELLAPLATRMKTDFELDYAKFMMSNTGLVAGDVGTSVGGVGDAWDDVARASSIMQSTGVPMDERWCYAANPFTQTKLASNQRSLGAGGSAGGLISEAHRRAILSDDFAGMRVMSATTLANYTTDAEADRAGTLSATPDATYLAAKDTMTQVLAVTGFGAGATVIKAGETIQVTAAAGSANRLNLSTRQQIVDELGAAILWTATVTADVTLTAGAGNIVVTGAAISEAGGQYNTVSQPLLSGDVVTLLGDPATLIQPNLFWHKQAFTCASVPIKKLQSIDTVATTEDGLQFRVSKGSDFIKNQQKIRVDFRPAYGVLNPFFAGQGFGKA